MVNLPVDFPQRTPLGGADLDASLDAGDTFNGRHKEIGHLKGGWARLSRGNHWKTIGKP
jgi:hypothetical protein